MVWAIHGIGGRLAAAVLAVVLAGAVCAVAADDVYAAGSVLVPFGGQYERDGRPVTHRGVDVEMCAGDSVGAFAAGEVTFAGSVPAASGETMMAVTVRDAEGSLWSYLPLDRVDVAVGDPVRDGSVLGRVASAGDASSVETHLHVGLRESGEYVDPAPHLALETHVRDEGAAEQPTPDPGPVVSGGAAPVLLEPPFTPEPVPQGVSSAREARTEDVPDGVEGLTVGEVRSAVPPTWRPAARYLLLDKPDVRRTMPGVVAGEQTSEGTTLVWLAPVGIFGAAATIALPLRSIRRRRARSEVFSDPRSTCLQPR
jgi:hypothetical protein